MNTYIENAVESNRTILDICPLPWRLEKMTSKPTKTCHHIHTAYHIMAANGNRVMMTEKLMTAFVNAANKGVVL